MTRSAPCRAHLIVGGFPAGSAAGHDMDYARLRILELLNELEVPATVANDYNDVTTWLETSRLLITYCAGPYMNDEQSAAVTDWLRAGGRWLALHGSSGGKAARLPDGGRRMEKGSHHDTLGSLFIHHPPVRKFRVDVVDRESPLTRGLPASFEVMDELYFLALQAPAECAIVLTTELPEDPTPPEFSWVRYDEKRALLPDGKSRPLGYTRSVGDGGVAYVALGHCHSPSTNVQPFVDRSVAADGKTPLLFRGPWETDAFITLLRNGVAWGVES